MTRNYYVELQITPEVLLEMHKANYKAKRYFWKIALISLVEILLGVSFIMFSGGINILSIYLFVIAVGSPIAVMLVRDTRSRHLKKEAEKSKSALSKVADEKEDYGDGDDRTDRIEISFYPNHFVSKCDYGDIQAPYDVLMMVREMSDSFMLYVNDDVSVYVPKSSFKEGDASQFPEFLKKRCKKDYKKIIL